jgi:hypothetical protein
MLPDAELLAAMSLVIAAFSTTCLAQENMSAVIFVAHELHLQERSGIGLKSWHSLHGKKNFALAVATSCSTCVVDQVYFGQENFGAGFWTTGRVDRRVGDRWSVSFPGPKGYAICAASLDSESDILLFGGGSTNGTLLRDPRTGENWVRSVSYAPEHGPEGHGVNVRLIAKYVPAGTEGAHHCAPNGTRVWESRR